MKYKEKLIPLTTEDYKTYARQLLIKKINIEGQQRLKRTKILFVGAGGLATGPLLYLTGAGIGNIGIIDPDYIELSNLNRQIIYRKQDINTHKAIAAVKQLKELNPRCNFEVYLEKFDNTNASQIVQNYDIIIDSTDNFQTRYLLSDICYKLHKIHIYGAVASLEGQVSVFNYQGGPSYKDLYPFFKPNSTNQCLERGVLGVVTGLIGLIQATEAIKIITGIGKVLSGEMLIYNSLDLSFKKIILRNTNHYTAKQPIDNRFINFNDDFENSRELSFQKFQDLTQKHKDLIYLIDIRNHIEYQVQHLRDAINIPIKKFHNPSNLILLNSLSQYKYIIIYCNSETRSRIASRLLHEANISHWILKTDEII